MLEAAGSHSWSEDLDSAPRQALATVRPENLPVTPGVFALYRGDQVVFLGRSAKLSVSISQARESSGAISNRPARRVAAEFLGIASSRDIAAGRYRPTPEDQRRITQWLWACTVAYRECASEWEAVERESRIRAERMGSSA